MSRAKVRAAVNAIRSDVTPAPSYTALLGIIEQLQAQLAARDIQIAILSAELNKRDERIAQLEAKVESLEARLAQNAVTKDSHNSNQPPSADDPYRKPKPAPRHKGAAEPRSVGGQAGHAGAVLTARAPDVVVDYPLPERCQCGTPLVAELFAARQVHDIPAPRLEVTEHRTYTARCGCGAFHKSQFPADVTAPIQYGPRIRANAAYLSQHHMLPVSRTAQILSAWSASTIAASSVQNAINEVIRAVAPAVELIRQAIGRAPVLHADETGFRVGGGLCWMHVLATQTLTFCDVHPQRGAAAIDEIDVLPHFRGILVHDGFAPYKSLLCGAHALCNAHHLRELMYEAESKGELWAYDLAHVLIEANRRVRETGAALDPPARRALWADYERLVAEGMARNPKIATVKGEGRPKQSTATNLLARLEDSIHEVLLFAADPAVPFTNNTAERTIRMPKVKQKIAGCFRTLAGARGFAAIRSYLSTLDKQNRNLIESLILALKGLAPNPLPVG